MLNKCNLTTTLLKTKVWENLVKGIWWMPRLKKTMKDVAACDKPRLGGKQPLTRGCPNEVTQSDGRSDYHALNI